MHHEIKIIQEDAAGGCFFCKELLLRINPLARLHTVAPASMTLSTIDDPENINKSLGLYNVYKVVYI